MTKQPECRQFLEEWTIDPIGAKQAFTEYSSFLENLPGVTTSFKSRPGISYSLRAKNNHQTERDLFVLVDVVDDEPDNRWLSVCFYADMIQDPQELGDFVPGGLNGEDAACFNLDENDSAMRSYIFERIKEAAKTAA